MYAVCVTFQIKPDMMDAFMPLVQQQAQNSLTQEAACHQFDVCTDPVRQYEVFLYELYENPTAFLQHVGSDHFKTFDAATREMWSDKQLKTYVMVNQPVSKNA